MNRILFLVFLVVCFFAKSGLFAQFTKGSWELGFGGAFGMESNSSDNGSNTSSNDITYFFASLMPGYYFADEFSIEPEIGLMVVDNSKPGISFIGNVSYSTLLINKSTAIFARLGYGFGNAISIPGLNVYDNRTDGLEINILNLGAGLKFYVSEKAYIRTEIIHRRFGWERENSPKTIESSKSITTMIIGIGISI